MVVRRNRELRAGRDLEAWLDPDTLAAAGMTWEDALSAVGPQVDKALLRNLRNFDFSQDGSVMRWDAAVVFGLALAARCQSTDVVSFATTTRVFPQRRGESVLQAVKRWQNAGYFLGTGTNTAATVKEHYADHNRVVILTDEQTHHHKGKNVTATAPANRPVYTWNLTGHRHGHAPSGAGNRHTFGGLTDQCFQMIPLLEHGQNADWPF